MSGWVTDRLGIRLEVTPSLPIRVELGLRRNPVRAHLLVSRVLGKHIPVPVADVHSAARSLGALVRAACAGQTPVIMGFAETATGLGHAVAAVSAADGTSAPYFHTTRRPPPPGSRVIRFREEHSHAAEHTLAVADDSILRTGSTLVLVDDELSTGATAVNAIRALHGAWPRDRYLLASLMDSRTAPGRAAVTEAVRALGAEVTSVSLLEGRVHVPADAIERAARLRARLPAPAPAPPRAPVPVRALDVALPAGVPATAMLGWGPVQERAAAAAMTAAAATLPVAAGAGTLVLGDEELMYLPQLLAAALGASVRTSATTRSPAVAVDVPGYPLRTMLAFPATEDGHRPGYAYNVAPSGHAAPGNAPGFDDIVLVTDAPAVAGLTAALARSARRGVHVITVHPGRIPGRGAARDPAAG